MGGAARGGSLAGLQGGCQCTCLLAFSIPGSWAGAGTAALSRHGPGHLVCCRLERWMTAALARPSAQQTKPDDDVIISGMAKYVAPVKQ